METVYFIRYPCTYVQLPHPMQEACTHVFRATFYMFLLFTCHSDSLLTIIFTAALLLIHIFILKMFIECLNTILVKII